ncbi:MAG: O-antigen ligase family protein [Acetobacteraceae bacterium]|nr:O-antigen ligase family protein [Acetobacteraceae bacterium]
MTTLPFTERLSASSAYTRAGLPFLLAVLGASALLYPPAFFVLLAGLGLSAAVFLAWEFPAAASAAWVLVVGLTPDMWLAPMAGLDAAQAVAVLKFAGFGLVLICLLRFGWRADPFNPGLAFLVMFAASLVHGMLPRLDVADSLRTLAGSIAPLAFCFSRLPRDWPGKVALAVKFLPLAAVALGIVLAATGARPLFVGEEGTRLAGPGHPAFLAGFAIAAVYACLADLLHDGRRLNLVLLGLNFLILALTGARAPLAIAVAVTALAMIAVKSEAFPTRRRAYLFIAAAVLAPVLLVLAGHFGQVRLVHLLSGDFDDLSGREVIWPLFEHAWDQSPWLGWGVGAGKVLVPEDSLTARLLGTTAAHNEYLRIGVDGGWLGLGLLVLLFVLWAWRHTRVLMRTDRIILRLVLIGFAVHSYTDNTLIATTSSVLFAWVTAVFARGAAGSGANEVPV